MSDTQQNKSSAHLLWTRLCAKPAITIKSLISKEKFSMHKNVADSGDQGQIASNKFCTQSVDKIVRKRTDTRQVH